MRAPLKATRYSLAPLWLSPKRGIEESEVHLFLGPRLLVADRTVWPELVSTPILHVKAHEPVGVLRSCIQTLGSELAVHALDVVVVRRFAWSREVEDDTL